MEKNLEKAKSYALNLLQIRQRSEKELIDRLSEKGYSDEIQKKVVGQLKDIGLVCDSKFAKAWIDSRLKARPKGDVVLRHELALKGIDEGIIDKALSEKQKTEEVLARELAENRMKRLKGVPKLKAKKRLHDYLARRGFKFDVIEDIVEKVIEGCK